MRVAVVLLALAGCAKQAAEKPASAVETNSATAPATNAPPATAAEAPPPPPVQQAKPTDEARAQGVLGPTDNGSAFAPLPPDKPAGKDTRVAPLEKASGGAAAAQGSVTIAKSNVKNEVLMDKLHSAMPAINACYNATLEKQGLVAGELTLQFAGDKVTIARSTLKNAELGRCVLEAIKKTSPDAKATITLAFKRS